MEVAHDNAIYFKRLKSFKGKIKNKRSGYRFPADFKKIAGTDRFYEKVLEDSQKVLEEEPPAIDLDFDSLDPASGGTGTITSDPLYVDRNGADDTLGTADDDLRS